MDIRFNIFCYRSAALLILIALTIFWGGSTLYSRSVRGISKSTIKIGVILDQTGPTAGDIALPIIRAIRNYTRHINDSGGIMGKKFKLIVEDDRYAIPAGIAAFKKLLFRDPPVSAKLSPVGWRVEERNLFQFSFNYAFTNSGCMEQKRAPIRENYQSRGNVCLLNSLGVTQE